MGKLEIFYFGEKTCLLLEDSQTWLSHGFYSAIVNMLELFKLMASDEGRRILIYTSSYWPLATLREKNCGNFPIRIFGMSF